MADQLFKLKRQDKTEQDMPLGNIAYPTGDLKRQAINYKQWH